MSHPADDTLMLSPVLLLCDDVFLDTPRTARRALRQQRMSTQPRKSAHSGTPPPAPVGAKRLPEGLIASPQPLPVDEVRGLVDDVREMLFLSSPSPQPDQSAASTPSLLKLKQMQRMQRLQFEHPSVNVTPQRVSNARIPLREILNANATTVRFTPKPPPPRV